MEQSDPLCSEIPEWLQEFREILVDDEIPVHGGSHARSSHERSLEPTRSVNLGQHSVKTHFPKDRNCEICQWTKITRAPRRRRFGRVVLRAENFGDLITADHKVLSDNCESRNNHRFAVVVQDLATQWIQSYPCKTKTFQETQWSLQKFLEPKRKPKVIYTDNSLEFGKSCKDLSWNHCTSTPHRSETNGIAERAVRRVKEGTSAVVLQSGLDEKWWADSMECYCCLRDMQDLLSDRTTLCERRFGEPPFGAMVEYHLISSKDLSRLHQFGPEVLPGFSTGYVLSGVRIWKGEEPDNLRGESDGSSSTPRQDASQYDGEKRNDFWSFSGDFTYRHYVEPRVKLYVPNEESFLIPLKHIDVTRTTDTTLDVMLEKCVDDYWNVCGDRDLSDTWTGSTRFTVLDESWEETDNKSTRLPDQTLCGQRCERYV